MFRLYISMLLKLPQIFFYFLSVALQIYIDCTQNSISHNQIINFMTASGTLSE